MVCKGMAQREQGLHGMDSSVHGWHQLDAEWLEGLGGGDDFLRDLFTLFARQCDDLLPLLRSQVTPVDVPQIVSLLHKLRGSACSVGLCGVAAQMVELEERLCEGAYDEACEVLSHRVRTDLEEALVEMKEFLSI